MDEPEAPPAPESNPFYDVVGPWEEVIEDMHAAAEQFRDQGKEVVELHPGDSTALTGEPRTLAEQKGDYDPDPQQLGLDVVVPGEEFERLHEVARNREFDSFEAFRGVAGGIVFLLIRYESADDEAVVFVPAYYERTDLQDLREVAAERGIYTNVRPLSRETIVTFSHADPSPLLPDPDEIGAE